MTDKSLLEALNAPVSRREGLLARMHLDMPLLVGLLVLCGYGLLVLASATEQDPDKLDRQLIRFAVAFGIMILLAQVPPRRLRQWSLPLYAVGVALLVAVELVGDVGKGAQRWLDLGFVRFQPSEIVKLAVPMAVAAFLSGRPLPPGLWGTLGAVLITLVPVLLIHAQPDLGTAILVGAAGAIVLFLAGLSWKIIAALGTAGAALLPVLWYFMLPYQRQRVLTFLDPSTDPLGSGYHIIQSQIAIGSGGVYGKGWLNGTQSHLEFLPERSTDFIFAVLGEELGLLGILGLLAIYLFVIGRGLYMASQAQDAYGRLLGGAVILVFFIYLFVNAGMVTGLLPVVGVPLPLISYGGTSLVTIMAGFGILMSVHTHKKLLSG